MRRTSGSSGSLPRAWTARALRRQTARIARGITILVWIGVAWYFLFYKEWWQPILGTLFALAYSAVYFPGKWLGFWN
jgi:hypothetical protein